MILQETPNNIYFKIEFKTPENYNNKVLNLLYGIYPKCISCKKDLLKYFKEEDILKLEDDKLLYFYRNKEQIKWKDIPEDYYKNY